MQRLPEPLLIKPAGRAEYFEVGSDRYPSQRQTLVC